MFTIEEIAIQNRKFLPLDTKIALFICSFDSIENNCIERCQSNCNEHLIECLNTNKNITD